MWCDERLKVKAEGSTRLEYTGFLGGLEHLKVEVVTRLIDERGRFVSVMGECENVTIKVSSIFKDFRYSVSPYHESPRDMYVYFL